MSLISTTIPNLVNGVSQQPYALRLPTQAEEQINGYSSVVEGLRKRPPTRHISRFLTTPTTNAFVHTINRDTTERYVVVISSGAIKVFDIAGNEKTVNAPNGLGYLTAADPQSEFVCLTVADYTFILNKKKVVLKAATIIPTRPHEALFWVRQGNYSQTYAAYWSSSSAVVTTPDSSAAANATQIATNVIASGIHTAMGTPAGYTKSQSGSVIYLANATTDFQIAVTDGLGGTALKGFKDGVQRFTELPAANVPDGFKIEVKGDNTSNFGNYWVEWAGGGSGNWRETAKPGELNAIDPATMPHVLVREADGTFTFKQAGWESRKVGDLNVVPFPSFVDRTINDIFFYRNRLGFLADENIVFSRSGEFFDFFRKSAIELLDTDPIDVSVSHTKISILRHAVPFQERLVLFSDQTQFVPGDTDLLTAKTISIKTTTEFEASLKAKPIGIGKNIFFALNRGKFTGIREYFVDENADTEDAVENTGHCPKYIPGNVVKIAGSSNEDIVAVLSSDVRSKLYVYRYYVQGNDKLQSSWSQWEFDGQVLNMDFIESDLYLVVSRADGTYIEVMSLEPGRIDVDGDITVHLDRRVTANSSGTTPGVTVAYNSALDRTTITLPYKLAPDEEYQLVSWYGDVSFKPGRVIPFTASTGASVSTLTCDGQLTSFFFGRIYEFRYTLSTLIMREDARGGGQQPVGEGRLQLRSMTVTVAKTGYFRAEVTPGARDQYTYPFSGRTLGSFTDPLGEIGATDGTFKFPIQCKNDNVKIELVSDSYLPVSFLSAEWEAMFVLRSRRM